MEGGGEAGLPRLRGGVGSEPLGVISESVSACTPLCQGMAAGMERRGPVIVYGLGAPTIHGVLCSPGVTRGSAAPPLPSSRTPRVLGSPPNP